MPGEKVQWTFSSAERTERVRGAASCQHCRSSKSIAPTCHPHSANGWLVCTQGDIISRCHIVVDGGEVHAVAIGITKIGNKARSIGKLQGSGAVVEVIAKVF